MGWVGTRLFTPIFSFGDPQFPSQLRNPNSQFQATLQADFVAQKAQNEPKIKFRRRFLFVSAVHICIVFQFLWHSFLSAESEIRVTHMCTICK